ncbi:hypothetical protein [Virgisporangium aurantiacum]|uniref:Uncharacterized protein n=1 Tax=Virgisporangium aurantiacum TaxID=175570 RepID=A0A8J4E4V8_9ACTN|nr:hypothetical protein [Virgisporangium aurantiacum]GIJ61453.1 hypothetical protein Vau01_089690 [Virgisporangium aurantiacum]
MLNALIAVTLAFAAPTWSSANSNSTGDQDNAAIATNRSGHVAVVWEDDRDTDTATNDNHSEVYLRLYKDGTSLYEIKVSAAGTSGVDWRHLTPDVGLDDKGNAVVVWADDPDGNGYYNIPYRVVSPSGSILASGQANADSTGQQIRPKVAVDPDGTPTVPAAVAFTVVWEDIQAAPATPTIRASGYTNITTKAYEVQVSQAGGTHQRPDVGVSAAGDATIVWNEDADANGVFNVGLVRLAKATGAVTLSRRVANGSGDGQNAAVATGLTGDFAVAWESAAQVWVRSFTAAGAARHPDTAVGAGAGASIGIDDADSVVVGRTASLDVFVRGFNGTGTTTGRLPDQTMSQVTAGRQEQFALAVSPWGEVPVCYTDDNDGNTYDQLLLGIGLTNSDW